MSENTAGPGEPAEADPVRSSTDRTGSGNGASSGVGEETAAVWVKAAGWFVLSMGIVTILSAFILRGARSYDLPFLVLVAMLLAGCSYILAGQALMDGYAWPLPFVPLSFMLSPLLLLVGPLHFLLFPLVNSMVKEHVKVGNLKEGGSDKASIAYALIIAAVSLLILWGVLESRDCAWMGNSIGHGIYVGFRSMHVGCRLWLR